MKAMTAKHSHNRCYSPDLVLVSGLAAVELTYLENQAPDDDSTKRWQWYSEPHLSAAAQLADSVDAEVVLAVASVSKVKFEVGLASHNFVIRCLSGAVQKAMCDLQVQVLDELFRRSWA